MPLALTLRAENVSGNLRHKTFDVDFDTSYPDAGEALTARTLGLHTVVDVKAAPQLGYQINYDRANARLRAFKQGPAVLTEATGTFTAGVAYTLQNIPGYILAVRGTAGSTGAKRIIPVGETAGAGQVAINWATGVCTWGDAGITAAIFVYIPRGVPGFTTDRLVIDEVVVTTTDTGTLAARAAAICYVWDDSNNAVLTYRPVGEAPAAAECASDINNGGSTTIVVNAVGTTDSLKVTYLRFAGNPMTTTGAWVDQADLTVTANVLGPGTDQVLDINGIVLPCYGQVIVGETGGAANLQAILVDAGGTAAANVAVYNHYRNTITFAAGDAYATVEIPVMYLSQELTGGVMQEVEDGVDLSFLTGIRLEAIGW